MVSGPLYNAVPPSDGSLEVEAPCGVVKSAHRVIHRALVSCISCPDLSFSTGSSELTTTPSFITEPVPAQAGRRPLGLEEGGCLHPLCVYLPARIYTQTQAFIMSVVASLDQQVGHCQAGSSLSQVIQHSSQSV